MIFLRPLSTQYLPPPVPHHSGSCREGALGEKPGFSENDTGLVGTSSLTPEEWVPCRDALRTHRYDAVIVGSGLRLIPDQTAVFEAVVNTIRTLAPATPMLFNEGPGTNIEALERTFGKSA